MSKYKGKEDKRQCVICGGKYVPNHVAQKYCGNVCRKEQDRLRTRARRNKMTKEQKDKHKQCSICDDSFAPNSNRQKYCSPACKDVAQKENAQRWNEENRDYKAEYSRQYRKGMTVEQRKKGKEAQRERDRKRHARNKPLKECLVCSNEFKTNENGAKYKYCSEHCAKEIRKKQNRERFRKENGLHDKYDYENIKKCIVCNSDISHMKINALTCSASCRQTIDDRKRGHKPMEEHLAIIGERKEQRLAKLELERSRKQLRNALNKAIKFKLDAQAEQERIKELTRPCEECGEVFYDPHPHTLTCSSECSRKRKNRWTRLYNSTRLNETNIIDRDISLEKLYKRDDGICYLCGGKCDYHDHTITLEGHYIAGPTHPSIDHVIAIANGGMHSWENIKLAHHRCNTLKSDIKLEEYTEALV